MADTENTISFSLTPGADTPEGAARLQKACEARNDIDFRAFQLLSRMRDEYLFDLPGMIQTLVNVGETKKDANEIAKEILADMRKIFADRSRADHNVLQAAAGRPE